MKELSTRSQTKFVFAPPQHSRAILLIQGCGEAKYRAQKEHAWKTLAPQKPFREGFLITPSSHLTPSPGTQVLSSQCGLFTIYRSCVPERLTTNWFEGRHMWPGLNQPLCSFLWSRYWLTSERVISMAQSQWFFQIFAGHYEAMKFSLGSHLWTHSGWWRNDRN